MLIQLHKFPFSFVKRSQSLKWNPSVRTSSSAEFSEHLKRIREENKPDTIIDTQDQETQMDSVDLRKECAKNLNKIDQLSAQLHRVNIVHD